MLLPVRGKILAEIISRERTLPSGLILPDKQRLEKKDNIARVLGVGDPVISNKGKPIPMIARRTDIIHYKEGFGKKLNYEGKKLIVLKQDEVIAIERIDAPKYPLPLPEFLKLKVNIIALGSMVICKLVQEDTIGSIIVPDNVKQNSGDFYGEVVAVGSDFIDKSLKKGGKVIFLRGEGYRFRTWESREELIAIKECWIYAKQ